MQSNLHTQAEHLLVIFSTSQRPCTVRLWVGEHGGQGRRTEAVTGPCAERWPQPPALLGQSTARAIASSILSHLVRITARACQPCHVYEGRPLKAFGRLQINTEREKKPRISAMKRSYNQKPDVNNPAGKPNSWGPEEGLSGEPGLVAPRSPLQESVGYWFGGAHTSCTNIRCICYCHMFITMYLHITALKNIF